MRERTSLDIHELTGSSNVRRELKRRLDAEKSSTETRYGTPEAPPDIDLVEEMPIWNSLVTELQEHLFRDDTKKLFELTKIEVLLAKSFRAAKHGSTRDGRANPAHCHVERYLRLRDQIKKQFTSRRPRPVSIDSPVDSIDRLLSQQEVTN